MRKRIKIHRALAYSTLAILRKLPGARLLQTMREAEEINRDDTSRYANVEEIVDSLDNGKK